MPTETRVDRVDGDGDDHGRETDDRADGDVEPSRDDHDRLGHRQHAEDRDGKADVDEVARR